MSNDPAVRQLNAAILAAGGDLAGATAELRDMFAQMPRSGRSTAVVGLQLAQLLLQFDASVEAEQVLRIAALADAGFPPARIALADFFTSQARAFEALELLEHFKGDASYDVARASGEALKALGRASDAAHHFRHAAELAPANAVAWHNLASVEGDLQRFAAAEAAASRALALGLDAPETWLVYARSLLGSGRFDAAEAAFLKAIERRPFYVEAHRELANLVWMRTGNLASAARQLDVALRARPDLQALVIERARLSEFAGDLGEADRILSAAADRSDALPELCGTAAQIAAWIDPDRAARHAAQAVAARPHDDDMVRTLAQAHLAQGRWREALDQAETLIARNPDHSGNLMLRATALRLEAGGSGADDPRDRIQAGLVEAPAGWPSLQVYLTELAGSLNELHTLKAHPVGQSLRQGTQASISLEENSSRALRAFPQAVHGLIQRYLRSLGRGANPTRRRNAKTYRFAGMWSVRLMPGGRHVDHIHPEGWISSVFYVSVPPIVKADTRAGWLKFGEPGIPTQPPLSARDWVMPEPGKLVLFPSHVWHGTAAFGGSAPRLTIAFDLQPG
jgi:tetratricopeptide (TPR) repeat protein